MVNQVDIWTYIEYNEIQITPEFGFTTVSILSTGGTTSILGSKVANGIPSTQIILQDGQSVTINTGNSETGVINFLDIIPNSSAQIIGR